jgi:hypothetical protein
MEFHALGCAGAAAGAADSAADGSDAVTGSCANAAAQGGQPHARQMTAINNALIIDWHPAAAVRGDYSPAAARASKIPTKQHLRHHPSPRTR